MSRLRRYEVELYCGAIMRENSNRINTVWLIIIALIVTYLGPFITVSVSDIILKKHWTDTWSDHAFDCFVFIYWPLIKILNYLRKV